MAKSFNYIRAVFSEDEQRKFLLQSQEILKLTNIQLAQEFKVCERTIRDWKNEKTTIPAEIVSWLEKATNLKPKYAKRDHREVAMKSALLGGRARLEKYGKVCFDESYRRQQWKKWWDTDGKFRPRENTILARKHFSYPKKSAELAELIGIILGDGGISKRQVTITLNCFDDNEYTSYVSDLIQKLFNVKPNVSRREKISTNSVVISRTGVVELLKELGLVVGNKIKFKVDIPSWIKSEKQFAMACLRGLFDTDGSVFKHCYKVKDKKYSYTKMAFTSASPPLINSVFTILKDLGLGVRISKNGRDIRIDSQADVRKYCRIIGSHNAKHLRKLKFNL